MSVGKIIELSATSTKSFEDAVLEGVKRAADTLSSVKGAWIKEQEVVIKDGKIAEYRVKLKVTFILESAGAGRRKAGK